MVTLLDTKNLKLTTKDGEYTLEFKNTKIPAIVAQGSFSSVIRLLPSYMFEVLVLKEEGTEETYEKYMSDMRSWIGRFLYDEEFFRQATEKIKEAILSSI